MSGIGISDEIDAGGISPGPEACSRGGAKPEKTAEELADIAFLDALREGRGERPPERIPLACIVKVLEVRDIPKAKDAYALARVEGHDGETWRMCVYRNTVAAGRNALFISGNAALPMDDRFRNPEVCSVKEKVYRIGYDKVRRLLPHVKRHIYRDNCGVLYPTRDFKELRGKRAGMLVATLLGIDDANALKLRQQEPRGKRLQPPQQSRASRLLAMILGRR